MTGGLVLLGADFQDHVEPTVLYLPQLSTVMSHNLDEWGSVPRRRPACDHPTPYHPHEAQHMQFMHYLGSMAKGLAFAIEATRMQVVKAVGTFNGQITDCIIGFCFHRPAESGSATDTST